MPYNLRSEFDLSDPAVVAVVDDLPLWSAPFGMKLLEVVRLRRNLRVLDVGPGTGFPIVELSQRLGDTCEVYAVDPWETGLDRMRQKITTWGITNLHIVEGQAESLDFDDSTFDLIVSNNGTNNVENEESVFSELGRVARPGAQMVLTMNLPGTMHEFYEALERELTRRGMAAEIERMKAHLFEKRKPLHHTHELLDRTGFEVDRIHENAFTMRFVDGTTMLNHFVIRLGFLGSWVHLLEERDVKPVFDAIEATLDRQTEPLTLTIPWACLDCHRKP